MSGYNGLTGINFICSEDEFEDNLQVRTKIYRLLRRIMPHTKLFAKNLEVNNKAILKLTLVFVMCEDLTTDGSIFTISQYCNGSKFLECYTARKGNKRSNGISFVNFILQNQIS